MMMKSKRPYLLRAFHQWIVDSQCTPILLVNAYHPDLNIPPEFLDGDEVLFNISPDAVRDFNVSSDTLSFRASFSGLVQIISVPIKAVLAVYAEENGDGCFFDEEELEAEFEMAEASTACMVTKLRAIDGARDGEIELINRVSHTATDNDKRKPSLRLVE